MSNVWRKTLVYLGLVEESEDADERGGGFAPEPNAVEERRDREPVASGARAGGSNVRPFPAPAGGGRRSSADRVAVVRPTSFDDAEEIGGRYREGQPVLFDLANLDTDPAKRILDFVSGVTYALRGRLVRAGRRAFLLLPEGLELSPDERGRLADLGYELEA